MSTRLSIAMLLVALSGWGTACGSGDTIHTGQGGHVAAGGACSRLLRAVARSSSRSGPRTTCPMACVAGSMCAMAGTVRQAIDDLDRAIELQPGLLSLPYYRGRLNKERGHCDSARRDLDAACGARAGVRGGLQVSTEAPGEGSAGSGVAT